LKNISNIQFHTGTKEELLPNYTTEFPYIASCCQLDKYMERFVPWHWHKSVELFYMESGAVEYSTPKGKTLFPAGSGGLINSHVLHMTRPMSETEENIQLNHIFDTDFLAGQQGGRIEQRYITPLIAAPQLEVISLSPEEPEQAKILADIRKTFELSEEDFGYEIRLRNALSDIWLRIFELARPLMEEKGSYDKANDKIKSMMVYIHEHYGEKLSISEVAAAAFTSERECYRAFQNCLHMTPVEYIKTYRLQMACQMLAGSPESITAIGRTCGLGSSSYFGKVFHGQFGCTPSEYRRLWQNNTIKGQK